MKLIDVDVLGAACRFLDIASEKQGIDEILIRLGASVSAVLHVADQRALRLMFQNFQTVRLSPEERVLCAKFSAAWIDGFSAALRVFQMNREEVTGVQEFKA